MLLQFSVENYKSFKERTVLSMEASSDKEKAENLTLAGRNRVLNSAVVFGANAAGKSNLFLALTAAILTVRQSNSRQINEPLYMIVPFCFDPDVASKPTSFEFVFIADGEKYVYGFSATRKEIVSEYLYAYHSPKASTVFERTEGNRYRFTSAENRNELSPMIEKNTPNKLFLATATSWNCRSTKTPYLWLSEKINTYSNDCDELFPLSEGLYADDENGSLRTFTNRLLQEADINIDGYEFESSEAPMEAVTQGLPKELKNIASTLSPVAKLVKIETSHTVEQEGTQRQVKLPLREESKGTQNLFMLSPLIKRAFDAGETLCVDEFDANLHPILVIYLLGLFNNPEVNRAHAQLIVSTHCTELLSLKRLRRDQIYFVDKDRKTCASELYSLDEFSPRNNENIHKAYMEGRYGSVPGIPEGVSL